MKLILFHICRSESCTHNFFFFFFFRRLLLFVIVKSKNDVSSRPYSLTFSARMKLFTLNSDSVYFGVLRLHTDDGNNIGNGSKTAAAAWR